MNIPLVVLPSLFCCAMAAAMKTRLAGGHLTGAVVLGLVCGLLPGLVQRLLTGEAGAAVFAAHPLVAAALGGAVAGAFCGTMSAHSRAERVFFWVEGLALGLTACVFADMAFGGASLWDNRYTPAIMALLVGLFCSLAPGFVRDVALGDTAGFVDESWYATAAALGIMLTLALRHFLPDVPTPLVEPPVAGGNRILLRHGPVLGGALLVLLLRFTMRGRGIH